MDQRSANGSVNCREIRPYLEAYADDELSTERTLDVDKHLAECPNCLAEVELSRAMVSVTRNAVIEVPLCPQFQTRLCRALGSERRKQEHRHVLRPLSWRIIAPLAAAAVATLVVGYQYAGSSSTAEPTLATADSSLVDSLLQHHARPPEPAVTAQDSVSEMEPTLGFPVRPPNLERYGARFVGASLVRVNHAHAALLHYNLANGRRVTFYVYDPEQLPLRAIRALHPRVVQNRAVFVGQRRGYSIATCERQGIGYAVAADLPDEQSAQLVAAVDSP